MKREEALTVMRRIVADFTAVVPGLRVEFLNADAFEARVSGRPLRPGEFNAGSMGAAYPLHAFKDTGLIIVNRESLLQIVEAEKPGLRGPVVEGLILREVLFLAACRMPEPDPSTRADAILRKHWPLQYVSIQGLLGEPGEEQGCGRSVERHRE